MEPENQFDLFLPPVMAVKAEELGVRKANMPFTKLFPLGVLAGAFISLGAIFCTIVLAGSSALPYGVARLLAGLVFCLGLILVVVGGAELFTGNNLIVMAWASGRVTSGVLLKNWLVVYAGNFVGSFGTALLVFLSGQYRFGGGAVGAAALATAHAKVHFGFVEAVALGTLCNALVCLAVWLTFSARTTTDRILATVPPIAAFVAAGFEHSVANMYFIPIGIFLRDVPEVVKASGKTAADFASLNWGGFLQNLIPVTIGNIIGGAVMVGMVYWFAYLRKAQPLNVPNLVDLHLSPVGKGKK